MAYCSASDVAAYTQNLLSPDNTFSVSTSPTLVEVNTWISSGCSIIETHLSAASYDVPIPITSPVYAWIRTLNAYFAVSQAELSRMNVITGPGERTRGMQFDKMFWDGLSKVTGMELTGAGVNQAGGGSIYVGGVVLSDKAVYQDNADMTQPRFKRGMFDFPGVSRPGGAD